MSEVQRLDKWLWYARVVKTRTMAAALVSDGKVRVNRQRAQRPSHAVRPGDVLTIAAHARIRVLRVKAPGIRRGPPSEAVQLYDDLTPADPGKDGQDRALGGVARDVRPSAGSRPTKRKRRPLGRLLQSAQEGE